MSGTAASTSSKMPDRYVAKRIGAASDPYRMPVSIGLASPVLPSRTSFTWRVDIKLPVHLMRSGSIPNASMRRPNCALLKLLNAHHGWSGYGPEGRTELSTVSAGGMRIWKDRTLISECYARNVTPVTCRVFMSTQL